METGKKHSKIGAAIIEGLTQVRDFYLQKPHSGQPENIRRVAFDFTDDSLSELDKLAERAGCSSRKELFNEAHGLLDYLIEQTVTTGNLPLIRTDEGLVEISNRAFLTAQKNYKNGFKQGS